MPKTIAEVVGENAHAARVEDGHTLADVTRAANTIGVKWSPGRVAHIEAGDRELSVDTLIQLGLALSELTGYQISPKWLLTAESEDEVTLRGNEHAIFGESLNAIIAGDEFELTTSMVVGGQEFAADMVRSATRALTGAMRRVGEVSGRRVTFGDYKHLQAGIELSDERVMKKLSLDESDYLGLCFSLWGQTLSEEVAALAPEGASPQKKGRISRELLGDLRRAQEKLGADREP